MVTEKDLDDLYKDTPGKGEDPEDSKLRLPDKGTPEGDTRRDELINSRIKKLRDSAAEKGYDPESVGIFEDALRRRISNEDLRDLELHQGTDDLTGLEFSAGTDEQGRKEDEELTGHFPTMKQDIHRQMRQRLDVDDR